MDISLFLYGKRMCCERKTQQWLMYRCGADKSLCAGTINSDPGAEWL